MANGERVRGLGWEVREYLLEVNNCGAGSRITDHDGSGKIFGKNAPSIAECAKKSLAVSTLWKVHLRLLQMM